LVAQARRGDGLAGARRLAVLLVLQRGSGLCPCCN